MNDLLTSLVGKYAPNGTGSLFLYYDFAETSTGVFLETGIYQGYVKSVSPSFLPNQNSGIIESATGSSEIVAKQGVDQFWLSDGSGVDLSFSKIRLGSFNNFLPNSNLDSELTLLFSFGKTAKADGVLFGSLRRDQFDNNGITGVYGRGFNIGINGRNKLFFQGIDSSLGEYVLTANSLELASKNICSAQVSPYSVTFGYYNLGDDRVEYETVRSNVRIENPTTQEPYYIGYSPTYKSSQNFSGYLDEFLLFSGSIGVSDLKSIASGLICSGSVSTGSNSSSSYITGYTTSLIYPTGITGYNATITGYQQIKSTGEFFKFILSSGSSSKTEGDRFLTGYYLSPNNGYLEQVGFLIDDDLYRPTGDYAHATLGLKAQSASVTGYTLAAQSVSFDTGYLPLYEITPLTGFLPEPTGIGQVPLTTSVLDTGSYSITPVLPSLESYKHDYLYYLDKRL